MRKIGRSALDARTGSYLAKQQAKIDAGASVNDVWKSARRTIAMGKVLTALHQMANNRLRCFYCEDSRGTDIEHFWPKGRFPARAFAWLNMLLVCSGCNNQKGSQFPCDGQGRPLLIDPTAENPWDHLYYDAETGELAARWIPGDETWDGKGQTTIDPAILPLNNETIGAIHYRLSHRGTRPGPSGIGAWYTRSSYPGQ
jgi:uncharacterized protein (TIGR02646 family)